MKGFEEDGRVPAMGRRDFLRLGASASTLLGAGAGAVMMTALNAPQAAAQEAFVPDGRFVRAAPAGLFPLISIPIGRLRPMSKPWLNWGGARVAMPILCASI